MTEATYKRLRHKYAFQRRGIIHVKGKGALCTYFLVGRRPNKPAGSVAGEGTGAGRPAGRSSGAPVDLSKPVTVDVPVMHAPILDDD